MPVDGSYLYKVGAALAPIERFLPQTLWKDAWLALFVASGELQTFINESVYSIAVRQSRENANNLLAILKEYADEGVKPENTEGELGPLRHYRISNALRDFQTVLSAEFKLTPLFLVTPKRGYDLSTLVYQGQTLFPPSVNTKVPAATEDLQLGVRCLGFELWTAGTFHLNRATEAVLRKYWDVKRPGKAHPGNKTISDYLRALRQSRKGSPKVKAALRDVKDLYRNPVQHPEIQIKDMDEAFAVLGAMHSAIVHMLDEIPEPPKAPTVASSPTVAST